MTSATATHLLELLDHLDKLKALHRAGESPSFGQVEALFDQAAVVRASLQVVDGPSTSTTWPTSAPATTHPTYWPTSSTSVEKAARRLVELVAASLAAEAGASR
jgi:hypothetical protein